MAEKRKRYGADFKFRVAMEAAKGQKTLNELASEYGVHPNQISTWKGQLLDGGPGLFDQNGKHDQCEEASQVELFEQIGRLKMDVTERKREGEALQESEARYRMLIENVAEGIGSVNPEEQFTFANPAAEGIFGVPPSGLLGRSLREFTTPEQFGVILEQTHRRRTGAKGVYEIEVSRPDGEKRNLLITTTPQFDSQGQFVGSFGVFRDITERRQAEAALRQSRDQLQAVLDASPAAISWIGADLRYRGINRNLAESLGLPDTEVMGEPIGFMGTSPELANFARDFFASELSEVVREVVTQHGDARRRYLVVARKYQEEQAAVLVGMDVTAWRAAEVLLRQSEERYRAFIEHSSEAIWRLELTEPIPVDLPENEQVQLLYERGYLAEGNQAMARLHGFVNADEVVGRRLGDLTPFLAPRNVSYLRTFIRSGYRAEEVESIAMDRQGHTRHFVSHLIGIVEAGCLVRAWGVQRDVTERKRSEEALRHYTEQLRELTTRLANAEEDERRRLALELHDLVGQNLTILSINLNIVHNLLPPGPAAQIGPRLEDSLELVSETVERIRDVMAELRPPVLDDYGLLAALRWHGQRFAQRTGLAIATQGADPVPRLPLVTEMTLFRIAQEALANAVRHAQARLVTIMLEALAGGVRLTIADDGSGFDPELRAQPNGRPTLGLLTMAERAESIGGRLVIDAAPGRGTRVIVEVGRVL